MERVLQVILLCHFCMFIFVFVDYGDAKDGQISNGHHRFKRYLSFQNFSNFFLRLNFKANMVPWTQIFAQAIGFRMNWDDTPDSIHPYHHLYRRTVYNNLEVLLDRNGLSGFHCVRRAICEMRMISEPRGIYYKILKMIFRKQSSMTDKWHSVTPEECQLSISMCPFSMLEVSLYTDF